MRLPRFSPKGSSKRSSSAREGATCRGARCSAGSEGIPWPRFPIPSSCRADPTMRIARRIGITQELIDSYGRANGDSERLHYDGEYARQHGFRGPIAHGTLLAATVFDLALQKFGPAFLRRGSVSLAWKSAVCAGDTQLAT